MYILLGIIALAASVGAVTLFAAARKVPYDDVAATKIAAWGFTIVSVVLIITSVLVVASEPTPAGEWFYLLAVASLIGYVFQTAKRYARGDWA